ncbi:MAG: DUF2442 domain-containing protein [Rikenellaceae bacterium]
MALLAVTNAKYVDGYKIALTFNDGVEKVVDLYHRLYGEVFEPLKDLDKFKKFSLSYYTIEWENGADLAPEYLYSL